MFRGFWWNCGVTEYRERLVPGTGTAIALLLTAPGLYLVLLPVSAPLAVAVAVAATALVETAAFLSAPIVAVRCGELVAGRAHIPVGFTGATSSARGSAATAARGVGLDARAWTLMRGWVDPVLRVEVTDPADPAPYWLVSTRRPEELGKALAAARADALRATE